MNKNEEVVEEEEEEEEEVGQDADTVCENTKSQRNDEKMMENIQVKYEKHGGKAKVSKSNTRW